jgi:molybdenum cofactor cytidylyltransferase
LKIRRRLIQKYQLKDGMRTDNAGAGFVGILLAAGKGSRFDPGGKQNKLLQPLPDGDVVVAAAAKHLLAVLPQVTAVVRPGADVVVNMLTALGCEVTVCPSADSGMGESLVHAISAKADASGWLIALGDMPFVQPSTMQALIAALKQGAGIAAPSYHGRRGNPVAFGRRHLPDLLQLGGDQGARSLLQSLPMVDVPVDDAGIILDIDTPSDLLSLR